MVSIFIHSLSISHLNEDIITQVFEAGFFEQGGFLAYFEILDMTRYAFLIQNRPIKRISSENPLNRRL
jgi:hypothetical protein